MKDVRLQGLGSWWTRWLITALVAVTLAACASTPELVRHGFGFDFISDSPEAELLDYRYGESKNPAARNSAVWHSQGKSKQQLLTAGEMLVGNELYVKWRLKSTGEVFEETVDLKSRLPTDIKGSRIYFMVRGSQLYVYLITAQPRTKDEPPNGPSTWSSRRTLTIYPDLPNR